MAKGRFTGGRLYAKGNPGGPGRPKVSPEFAAVRVMNQERLAQILNALTYCTHAELKEKAKDPSATVFELAVAKVIEQAFIKGDQARLSFLLDRLVGKVKEQVDVTGGINVTIKDYSSK